MLAPTRYAPARLLLHAMLPLVLWQLHKLIQADFARIHPKALKSFVEVDLLKCNRLLSQL
jgi:hypothetical protein